MKNITLSADEDLIDAARKRAQLEQTTLNEQFRLWLEAYAHREQRAETATVTLQLLREHIRTDGLRFTRDEMNER